MLTERLLYVENAWDKNAVCENVEPSCEITKAEKAVEKNKTKNDGSETGNGISQEMFCYLSDTWSASSKVWKSEVCMKKVV